MNVILTDTHERLFSSTEPMKSVPIGVYVIRGETIAIIGQLDEELDEAADYENMRIEPLDPIFL
ncbi:N(alpha)-acetyltransferase 38, NatC auxiliary [Podila epicladia]|nr:N(alpha)-acetyltransferase 38, NatC auxiliary [Podila epicladia]